MAPETIRIVLKLAASMVRRRKANRQSRELVANAIMAIAVNKKTRARVMSDGDCTHNRVPVR